VLVFSESVFAKNKSASVHVDRHSLRAVLAVLRLEMLFFGSHFLDLAGFELAENCKRAGSAISVVYVFFLARWGVKLVLGARFFNWARIAGIGEFFSGAIWPERECAELLGVSFAQKLDARRLMVDYTFEGAPLSRGFPAVGYEELEFSLWGRGLLYSVLRLRDEAEVAGM